MGNSPRDFPEWMRAMERSNKNASRSVMRALGGVRDDVGTIREEVGGIKDGLDNLPILAGTPTAPIELTGDSALYVDEKGAWRARINIDFPDVVRTVTGQPITVYSYELQGYERTATLLQDSNASYPGKAYPGSTYPGTPRYTKGVDPVWSNLGTSSTSGFVLYGLPPGQVWMYRVRAAGGEWSVPFRIETLRDTTPPPQPTAPKAEAVRGVLMVTWDGQAVTGGQSLDFEEAVLVGGPDPSPGLDRELYRFGAGGGTFAVPGVEYYETWFFRIISVDQSGNWSVWSEQATAYPKPMVDADIILTELDAAKTHLKNVNAGVSILPNTVITEHLLVTESMSAAIGNFLHVRADMLEANDIWADNAWLGYAEAALVKADMFVGKEFIGGTFTGSTFRTAVTGNRVEMTENGIRAVDGLGRELLKIGYGIETGLAVRNPALGQLVPLDRMVFGTQRYSALWKSATGGDSFLRAKGGQTATALLYDQGRYDPSSSSYQLLTFIAQSDRHEFDIQFGVNACPPIGSGSWSSVYSVADVHLGIESDDGGITPYQFFWNNCFSVPYSISANFTFGWQDTVTGLVPGRRYRFRFRMNCVDYADVEMLGGALSITSTPI